MKVIIKYLLSIVFVFLLNTFNTFANESIKIGLLVPLTGEYDDIGKYIESVTTFFTTLNLAALGSTLEAVQSENFEDQII